MQVFIDPPRPVQRLAPDYDGDLAGIPLSRPPRFSPDRNGVMPRTEAAHAALWARCCADHADDFPRFLRLLRADYGLADWVDAQSRRALRAIWAKPQYRRPAHWAFTLRGVDGCAADRWDWLCAPLSEGQRAFHAIPDGFEAEYCEAFELLRFQSMRGRHPDMVRPKGKARLPKAMWAEIVAGAREIRDRADDWSGSPWRVVKHARAVSRKAWKREWPQRRAGERLTFEPPIPRGHFQ